MDDEWYFAALDDELDAVATVGGDHMLIRITSVVEGKREIVAIMTLPTPPADQIESRMMSALGLIDRGDIKAPLGIVTLRIGAMRETLARRLRFVHEAQRAPAAPEEPEMNFEPEQMDYLPDAIAYVQALRMGEKPADVIAERRDISKRTAEGRIVKARRLGLLTPAKGKVAGGELTPLAEMMRAERNRERALRSRRS